MRYLFDTNVISALCRFPDGSMARRVAGLSEGDLGTSIIVVAELRFGYTKVGSARLQEMIEETLASFEIAPWDAPADIAYARLRVHLERAGTPIGQNDMLIAAHALALDAMLITDNAKEFSRVPGLKLENWLRP